MGSIIGSFANVVIYRLPIDKKISKGRSFCPKCKKKINWYDNIPIISFFILNGKCRKCKKPISFRYFFVEAISAFLFFIIYFFFNTSIETVLFVILSIFLLIIFFIDSEHYIIPDELTFPLMVIGFLKSFDPNLNTIIFPNFVNSLIGGVFGYLLIWSIIFLSSATGLISVLPSLITKKRKLTSQIPFGPYIILAAFIYFFFSYNFKGFIF